MRGRSSGKTGPPVPGLTRVGGGAINSTVHVGQTCLPLYHTAQYGIAVSTSDLQQYGIAVSTSDLQSI